MRITTLAVALLASVFCAHPAVAQSTISDRAYEWTGGIGPWGVFLPNYELGANTSLGGPAYSDDLDDTGGALRFKSIRRFLGTRTSFESQTYYAYAESSSDAAVSDIDIPNPITGASTLLSGGAPRLDSKVDHYGLDLTLRDTWQTRFGGLSAGVAFGYMRFDQEFDVEYSATDLFREDLDSKFTGGKAVFGWDGCLKGHACNLNLAVGFYDLDADYRVLAQPGRYVTDLNDTATTFEASFTARSQIRGYGVSMTPALMYISDMPMINHTPGAPVSLGTDDALTLAWMFEVLLL